MSYDLKIVNSEGEEITAAEPHSIRGGTYALEENRLRLNITYNYWPFFHQLFGEEGIRWLYGKTIEETLPRLWEALRELRGSPAEDYWAVTEGNAREAIWNLIRLAELATDPAVNYWDGD